MTRFVIPERGVPRSLLSRLAASVPAPRAHTVKYAGVMAAASKLRARIVPRPKTSDADAAQEEERAPPRTGSRYRPWAELLKRTFEVDVLHGDRCQGRMRLVALVLEDKGIASYLRTLGEPTSLPSRAPARGPMFWQSRVLRRASGDDVAAWSATPEAALRASHEHPATNHDEATQGPSPATVHRPLAPTRHGVHSGELAVLLPTHSR